MKKLKLDLDRVQVSSFALDTKEGGRGTVVSHNTTFGNTADWGVCGGSLDSCASCFPHDCPQMPISWEGNC